MRIQKFLHSCLLISEGGERLLIDPGAFSFIEGKVKPADIGGVDVILLTHEHADHYYPEALRAITAAGKPAIITHARLRDSLQKEGLDARVIQAGEMIEQGPFKIQAIKAPHGDLPVPKPENLGYLINGTLFHPGDSLEFPLPEPRDPSVANAPSESAKSFRSVAPSGSALRMTPGNRRFSGGRLRRSLRMTTALSVLALPVTAPWLTLKQALDTALRVNPQIVTPIHDAIMKDFMLERVYGMCEKILSEQSINFRPLQLGEVLEV